MISVLVEDIYQQLSIIMVLYIIFLYYLICHQMVKKSKVNSQLVTRAMNMILILEEADYQNKYFPIGFSERSYLLQVKHRHKQPQLNFLLLLAVPLCSDIPVLHFFTALFSITSFIIKFRKNVRLEQLKKRALREHRCIKRGAVQPSANSLF